MLPARHRLRTAADFSAVVRGVGGARSGGPLLVVHARYAGYAMTDLADQPVRAGFVVSKAVGGAVTRNRTKRVLRHLVAARLPGLTSGLELVVRAAPAAGAATTEELAAELDRNLTVVLRRLDRLTAAVPS